MIGQCLTNEFEPILPEVHLTIDKERWGTKNAALDGGFGVGD